jgi:hypothetical protein
VDVTRLNLRRLGHHSIDFAALRLDADRMRHSSGHGRSEILQKAHARTRILDQNRGRAMLRSETDDLAAQFRIFEATPVDMEEVRVILVGEPRGACRIVVLTARHHGDVPALHDPCPRGTRGQVVIGQEP